MGFRRVVVPAVIALAGCSGQQVLNAFTPGSGYGLFTDRVYDAGNRLVLDVYAPAGADHAPVVVFFYGGRWSRGTKDDYRFAGQALTSKGFVAMIPNYREYPAVKFPAMMQDAAKAVRWSRDNAPRYGGDGQKLFVMGHSSGAHMAALLALDKSWLEAVGGKRSWLRGMIGLAGPYDFMPITASDLRDLFGPPERFDQSQPVNFADGDNPPLLLMHGANDDVVQVENTRSLSRAVTKAGGPVTTVIYPDMSHTWIVATMAAPLRGRSDVLDQVGEFVRAHAEGAPAPRGGPQAVEKVK
jgi:acetyl esterase/lipase